MSLGLAETLRTTIRTAGELLTHARSATLAALRRPADGDAGDPAAALADRGLEGAVRALALYIAVPVTVTGGLAGGARRGGVGRLLHRRRAPGQRDQAQQRHGGLGRTAGPGRRAVVVVGDNGAGGAGIDGGTGLRGVARRLESFDGTVTVSSPAGGSTTVTMEAPRESSSPKT